MENYDEYDSIDVYYCDNDTSDVESNDVQDDKYSVSSAYQISDDGADNIHNDDLVEVDVIVGDRLVNIYSITTDEMRAMEFGIVDEAYEFYYRYGKCKGFSIRKSDVRTIGPEGSKITVMMQFVCKKTWIKREEILM
ncbi:unnamed protein product [Vicia faba]|uniref:FAR1 domain-containing protein n=1 Tax=Vicia faba TaxID=3906 RepID=A0AAV1AUQ5_VICFA|nr:unnamed protein product [Vicia faba]